MERSTTTLFLNSFDLEKLVDVPATIAAVESIFQATALGRAAVPVPAALQLPGRTGRLLSMAALAEEPRLACVKMLADLPDNPARGIPAQRSVIVLVDADDGTCLAVLAGRVPTRERTAAASAVATKYLARPDSRVLGLVGAGALAVAHIRSHLEVLRFERVLVWSRSASTRQRCLELSAELPVDVQSVDTVRDVFDADVICTLTPSLEPLVHGAWIRPGQHINVVGAPPRATHREVDDDAITKATVFVDNLPVALAESGDVCIPLAHGVINTAHISRELGDVIAGALAGRQRAGEITLFDSVGLASQDLAIGALLLQRARECGVGIQLDLAS